MKKFDVTKVIFYLIFVINLAILGLNSLTVRLLSLVPKENTIVVKEVSVASASAELVASPSATPESKKAVVKKPVVEEVSE